MAAHRLSQAAPDALQPVVIAGPTACGKTELALALARLIGGEIVSVDSRQVYRRLDAGTAKPEGSWVRRGAAELYETEGVPYHLVDILEPVEDFDAGRFCALAAAAVEGIRSRGKVPIFAGGAGMYLQAYFNGLDPLPPRDEAVRARLEAELAGSGSGALMERLRRLDGPSADWAGANPRRLTRALEVHEVSGRPIAKHWSGAFLKDLPGDKALFIGLQLENDELQGRIERRSEAMWPALTAETARLLESGLKPEDHGLRTLGYPEAVSAVLGRASYEEGKAALIKGTLRYAKRQRTWFRRYKNLLWLKPAPSLERDIAALRSRRLAS